MSRDWIDTSKPCPGCGVAYAAFRGRHRKTAAQSAYGSAYHEIAFTREHVSGSAVKAHLAACKREEWARHVEGCGIDTSEEISDVQIDDLIDAPRLSFAFGYAAEGPGSCTVCAGWGFDSELVLCPCCQGHGSAVSKRMTIYCDARATVYAR